MLDARRHPLGRMLAAGLVLATVACGRSDEAGTTMDTATGSVATATPGTGTTGVDSTMLDAHASSMLSLLTTVDQSEIEAGQLAVQKARSQRVKDFAQQMIDEHTEARRRLSEMGTARGWSVPGGGGADSGTPRAGGRAGTGSTATTGGITGKGGATGSTGMMTVSPDTVAQLMSTHQRTMNELRGVTGTAFDRAYIDAQLAAHQRVLNMLRASSSSLRNGELADHVRDMADRVQEHLEQAQEIQRSLTGDR
jgi:putative membrane protein